MAAPIIATHTRSRSTTTDIRILAAVAIFTIAAVVSLVAVQFWGPASIDGRPAVQSQYGAGYPQQGGLAGPSRVSVFEMHGYGAGYPLHGGLAGAAGLSTAVDSGYGAGYPLHGGLAGPSQIDD